MPGWRQQIKDYFSFSKTERRGIVVLLGFIILLVAIYVLIPYMVSYEKIDFSEFQKEVTEFENALNTTSDSLRETTQFGRTDQKVNHLTPFMFDPNGLPFEQWKQMGFSDRQIKIIKNYESKGGRFRKKEDLAKIYGISAEEYSIMEPFIQIDATQFKKENNAISELKLNPFTFDPNTITEAELKKMGLREHLIQTLVNYRNKGGRFTRADDLSKIYGIKPDEFALLEPWVQINIDSLSVSQKSRC